MTDAIFYQNYYLLVLTFLKILLLKKNLIEDIVFE